VLSGTPTQQTNLKRSIFVILREWKQKTNLYHWQKWVAWHTKLVTFSYFVGQQMPILNCDWSSALLILSTDEYRLCDIKNCPNLTHPYKIVTLASSSTRIWWLRNTLMASSVVASINYGPSADHWCSMLHMYWYRHSFTGESTTATPSSMESATGLSESCNQYCMLLPIWWLVSVGTRKKHIMQTLRDVLHWLPVKQWITSKNATMAFSCVSGTYPVYFSDVCTPVQTCQTMLCTP